MKIALCCRVYPTHRPGGMPFVCQDRARALVKMGHEVHVLTTGRETHRGEVIRDDGVEVHHMPCKPVEYSQEYADNCLKHCRGFLPDIVHLDGLDVNRPWWTDHAWSHLSLTLHGFGWGAHFTRWNIWKNGDGQLPELNSAGIKNEIQAFNTFQTVIGISIHEHWMLRDLMGVYNAKLVYNPVASCFFTHPKQAYRPGTFLCAAVSGHRERGFRYAQEAALRTGKNLVVQKDAKREALPAILDGCQAVVLPTAYAQGCDLVVSEAIVRGRPVIATATGSYLREAELGGIYQGAIKLVPLGDVSALSSAMMCSNDWVDWRNVKPWLHNPSCHAEKWLEAIL